MGLRAAVELRHGPVPDERTARLQADGFGTIDVSLSRVFLQIGATGDDLAILRFAADENVSSIAEEAVAHCFSWSNPRATGEFFDWVRANDDGRMWTFAFLDSSWARYQAASAVDRLDAQDAPTMEDLDHMSDEEIEKALIEARRLRSQGR